MAVLPKKYSKRGTMSIEDYIIYMSERIEFADSIKNKQIQALTAQCEEQANELAKLKKIIEREIKHDTQER